MPHEEVDQVRTLREGRPTDVHRKIDAVLGRWWKIITVVAVLLLATVSAVWAAAGYANGIEANITLKHSEAMQRIKGLEDAVVGLKDVPVAIAEQRAELRALTRAVEQLTTRGR